MASPGRISAHARRRSLCWIRRTIPGGRLMPTWTQWRSLMWIFSACRSRIRRASCAAVKRYLTKHAPRPCLAVAGCRAAFRRGVSTPSPAATRAGFARSSGSRRAQTSCASRDSGQRRMSSRSRNRLPRSSRLCASAQRATSCGQRARKSSCRWTSLPSEPTVFTWSATISAAASTRSTTATALCSFRSSSNSPTPAITASSITSATSFPRRPAPTSRAPSIPAASSSSIPS